MNKKKLSLGTGRLSSRKKGELQEGEENWDLPEGRESPGGPPLRQGRRRHDEVTKKLIVKGKNERNRPAEGGK